MYFHFLFSLHFTLYFFLSIFPPLPSSSPPPVTFFPTEPPHHSILFHFSKSGIDPSHHRGGLLIFLFCPGRRGKLLAHDVNTSAGFHECEEIGKNIMESPFDGTVATTKTSEAPPG
jgi:hypothetical protein